MAFLDLDGMLLSLLELGHLGVLARRLSALLETSLFGQTVSLLWWTYSYELVLLLKTWLAIRKFISLVVDLLVSLC